MTGNLHIVFAPLLSAFWLEGLACTAFLLTAFALYRRARGGMLRAALFALLLLVLANPSVIEEQHEPLKDTALVVIDESASMKIGDRTAQMTKALDAINKKLAGFSDLDVETLHIQGDEETDLFHALLPKLASLPHDRMAGVIALTDGQVHDVPESAIGAPFHVLIAGHHNEIDRRITVKEAPAYGIVGKKVTLTLRIDDEPKPQSDTANVTFQSDDGGSQTFTMPIGKDIPFDVPMRHAGPNLFAFDVEPLPHELTTINNSAAVSVNGIRDRLRVLLVSGQPHIGGRTWRNFLKADPAVDLVHFTILRSPFKDNTVPNNELALIAFPVHELFDVKLKSFDLIILDRFSNRTLVPDLYLENIAKYVEGGGALLVSNATDEGATNLSVSPLSRILPAVPSGRIVTGAFVPDLSDAGKRHPVTATLIAEMPRDKWGNWFRQAETETSKGDVLMTGLQGQPLLVLDHVGRGRIAEFLSDQFWLWSRGYEGGGPHAELLRRVAHWLVQEPDLDETALRARGEHDENGWQLVITKQSLHDTSDDVDLTGPDGSLSHVVLTSDSSKACAVGALCATVPLSNTGLYHLKDKDQEIMAMVGSMNAPEFGDMVATEEKLAPFVKATSGGIAWLEDDPDGPEIRRVSGSGAQQGWNWIGLRKNDQYRITGSKAWPLWPAWLALLLLLVVAMVTWRREGQS